MQLLVVRKCLSDKTPKHKHKFFHLALVDLLYRMLVRPKGICKRVVFDCCFASPTSRKKKEYQILFPLVNCHGNSQLAYLNRNLQ